ncbi:MAG: hypothetical protein AAGA32_15045 [Pseudomonadota bacterium]
MFARLSLTLVCVCALVSAALATPARLATGDDNALVDIPKAEWINLVRGRTVIYNIGPNVWAFESYPMTGPFVSIKLADGTCMDGTWEHVDGAFCFRWENREYSCFRHARDGADILIIPVVDGVQSGTVQTVSAITDAPVGCGSDLIS